MTPTQDLSTASTSPRNPERQADGRDGRIVGEHKDGVLESIGKAIVAPVEGADEGADGRIGSSGDADAEPVDDQHGRAFVDLTKTLPQGQGATQDPTVPKPTGKAL